MLQRHMRIPPYGVIELATVRAHHALPLAAAWGAGTTSSSDGQYFRAGRRGGGHGSINGKYGTDPGMLFYTHLSDQHGSYRSKSDLGDDREAPLARRRNYRVAASHVQTDP
jgi:TnpA family transposase